MPSHRALCALRSALCALRLALWALRSELNLRIVLRSELNLRIVLRSELNLRIVLRSSGDLPGHRSEQCQLWSEPSFEWTPPSCAIEWIHPTLCYWVDSTLPCAIEWTPPYPLQLFLTANSVSHRVDPLINALHPTLCYWVDSTLPSSPLPPPILLSWLHPIPVLCLTATCILYSEQCQPWSGPSY